ncbi:hypothetical protein ACLOJK_025250 [Asimina triloba]
MGSAEEGWARPSADDHQPHDRSGYDPKTSIYHSLHHLPHHLTIPTSPNLDAATYVLSQFPPAHQAHTRVALIDSADPRRRLTYTQLHFSVRALAAAFRHGLGLRKGHVVLLLSPNSILYPTISLAVISLGAVLTTANPLSTAAEIARQVRDSGATIAVSAPEELYKLLPLADGLHLHILLTTKDPRNSSLISVEELLEGSEPLDSPPPEIAQSDTAAFLYSSGTTGVSKGVVLNHANLISAVALFRWAVESAGALGDVYLAFLPMFHIYGLACFALALLAAGVTTVVMPRFDFGAMLEAIHAHRVSHVPAVPPVLLALVKSAPGQCHDLSSLRRATSGAAPLSEEVAAEFRARFPWVELRQGYGMTESSGAGTIVVGGWQGKERAGSVGQLFPTFRAKVADAETGGALGPNERGEIWLKSPTVMKGYLGNEEATAATVDADGWLRTGDLGYFDEDGFVYIVDRMKELIKHNGYQVAPAELEAILVSHPDILDAAVIPREDEATGQIPVAYVVRKPDSNLEQSQVIQFVASQVAPYKKIKKVSFIDAIPKSAAGKILRKQLVALQQQQQLSKL